MEGVGSMDVVGMVVYLVACVDDWDGCTCIPKIRGLYE